MRWLLTAAESPISVTFGHNAEPFVTPAVASVRLTFGIRARPEYWTGNPSTVSFMIGDNDRYVEWILAEWSSEWSGVPLVRTNYSPATARLAVDVEYVGRLVGAVDRHLPADLKPALAAIAAAITAAQDTGTQALQIVVTLRRAGP